ncbi:hypothetical protein C6B38_05505, partial [Spiroplasma sp. ChiS]|uniref:hypothetical protein n=1 Tax=Spiroplasma sp. ChiS TaxID=2099885 RepID=UPI000D4A8292
YTDENNNEQYNLDNPIPIKLDNPIPIKELSWTFKEWDSITKQYKTITTYFHKTYSNQFTFNPFDKYHVFYEKFVTPYLPLNERIKTILKEHNPYEGPNANRKFNCLCHHLYFYCGSMLALDTSPLSQVIKNNLIHYFSTCLGRLWEWV